jgi:hypothetical protein
MTSAPERLPRDPPSRDWKLLTLVLVPVACCALGPFAIAALASAGAAVISGTTAAVVVLGLGIGLVVVNRRRRHCPPTYPDPPYRVQDH